jgi:hypothetical protein
MESIKKELREILGQREFEEVLVSLADVYKYDIYIDEPGVFEARVRDPKGNVIFRIDGLDIFKEGFMSGKNDIAGLERYLKGLGFLASEDSISN